MNAPKINPELLNLLKSGEFDVFTCPALTHAYFDLPACKNSNKKGASKLIARHVRALTSQALIEITSKDNVRPRTYRLTDKFHKFYSRTNKPEARTYRDSSDLTTEFKEKLRNYKIEILEVAGELEEYEELSISSPDKLPEIQELYRHARDRFSRTQGRIKALENMLSTLESNKL